jgi:hypothetical protein
VAYKKIHNHVWLVCCNMTYIYIIFWNSTLIYIGFDEDNDHVIFEILTCLHGYIFFSLINGYLVT